VEEADKVYVENNTLFIVKLYIEGYMYSKQGFKQDFEEKFGTLEKVKEEIKKVIEETSEYLCREPNEVLETLIECLQNQKDKPDKMKFFGKDYLFLEEVLQNIEFNIERGQER